MSLFTDIALGWLAKSLKLYYQIQQLFIQLNSLTHNKKYRFCAAIF
jgi:hypothetical protein